MATENIQTKSEEVAHLEEVFRRADKNEDGFLSESELTHMLRVDMGRNLSDIAIKKMFQDVDEDGDGRITMREFVMQLTKPSRRQALMDLFKKADKDGNGILTRDEVTKLCKSVGSYTDDEVVEMIQQVDKNGDGKIDLKEFLGALL